MLLGLLIMFSKSLTAQVQTNNFAPNQWMGLTTVPSIRSVGFGGNFSGTGGAVPQARFHLSDYGWALPLNGSVVQGRLFRTDGLFSAENSWSMWSGTAAPTAVERFRLATYASSNNAYFGTVQNGWLNVRTNNENRMKLNADVSYSVNGYNQTRDGYLLIGNDGPLLTGAGNIYAAKGAFSLLHLNGEGANVQELGYRPWMRTGMTLTGNNDLSYFGLRPVGTTQDRSETVIAWTDNQSNIADEMVFRFLGQTQTGTMLEEANFATPDDLDGLHVARFTPFGLFGLGNTFGHIDQVSTNSPFYNTPRSLMHLSYQFRPNTTAQPQLYEEFGFMQITYRRPNGATTNIIGQGELATDGLRLGIDNQIFQPVTGVTSTRHMNGYLRWQEASSFIIQTEDDTTTHDIEQNERIRVTSIGALKRNYAGQYLGLPQAENTTRISISESGSTPLTKPMSLLHLGYNYGEFPNSTLGQQYAGYRKWMDLGMLASTRRDHVWVGIKPRDSLNVNIGSTNDKMDAVIGWGTDFKDSTTQGADNMRFIFTSDPLVTSTPENPVAKSYDGLEMMRLYPSQVYNHPIYNASGAVIGNQPSYGRVGIGDFTSQGVNEEPTHKLDVVGNGRFRYLPDSTYMADTLVKKIVMVDEDGVLRWNSFVPSSFGAACSDTQNGKLQFDTKVDMNDHNLYFTRNDSIGANKMGIGYDCGVNLEAKLNVYSKNETWSGSFYVDGNSPVDLSPNSHQGGVKSIIDSTKTLNATAVYGYVAPNLYTTMVSQVGVKGEVLGKSVKEAVGVYGISTVTAPNNGAIGGRFLSNGSGVGRAVQAQNFTVQANATPGSGFGFGGDFNCNSASGQSVNSNVGVVGSANGTAQNNTGVRGLASGNGIINMGVYGEATGGGQNWAGYFQGNVYISGSFGPSDQNLKENVATMEHADSLLSLLNPVTFDFKTAQYPQLQLQNGNQMGLIAQQVEPIFPSMVRENTSPAQYDSLGNVTVPSVNFKTVDYTKLIPLLIAGHQEQANEIEAKDSIIDALTADNATQQQTIDDLNARLTNLENCLSALLPTLCSMNQSLIQNNTPAQQEAVRQNLSVTLSDRSAIILDQNVPNPFAEQTVINFSIPATVQKAQIHFYDGNGKLMQSVDVNERGLGSLTVFGSDLSTGVYTYTLVADGQIVATKKMMKQ